MLNIISWIIFGVIAGAIAKLIIPGRQGGGFWSTSILGILGAFVGGILHNLINKQPLLNLATKANFSVGSFVIAVLGAIVFVVVWSFISKKISHS
jgi:uncharacterized membrane protein YeaQ/YmgE (transglycosylase-associated protein family)